MYLDRRVTLCRGSVAQLANVVSTPSPDCAVAFKREALLSTGGDRDNPVQVLYLHRRIALIDRSVAQLALAIPTPGPNRAICRDPQTGAKPPARAMTPLSWTGTGV